MLVWRRIKKIDQPSTRSNQRKNSPEVQDNQGVLF